MIQFLKNILSTAIGMILSLAVIAAILIGVAAIVGSEKDIIVKKRKHPTNQSEKYCNC
jgi:hypothetical protein